MAGKGFDPSVSARQTGYNVGASIVNALATAGLLESQEQAIEVLEDTAATVFDSIVKSQSSAPERQPLDLSNPGAIRFTSGKHDGSTIAEVAEEAPDYLDWYAENVKKGEMVKAVRAFLDGQRAGV